jgi:hypothetical protein
LSPDPITVAAAELEKELPSGGAEAGLAYRKVSFSRYPVYSTSISDKIIGSHKYPHQPIDKMKLPT